MLVLRAKSLHRNFKVFHSPIHNSIILYYIQNKIFALLSLMVFPPLICIYSVSLLLSPVLLLLPSLLLQKFIIVHRPPSLCTKSTNCWHFGLKSLSNILGSATELWIVSLYSVPCCSIFEIKLIVVQIILEQKRAISVSKVGQHEC
jgi:hypothetical protein